MGMEISISLDLYLFLDKKSKMYKYMDIKPGA